MSRGARFPLSSSFSFFIFHFVYYFDLFFAADRARANAAPRRAARCRASAGAMYVARCLRSDMEEVAEGGARINAMLCCAAARHVASQQSAVYARCSSLLRSSAEAAADKARLRVARAFCRVAPASPMYVMISPQRRVSFAPRSNGAHVACYVMARERRGACALSRYADADATPSDAAFSPRRSPAMLHTLERLPRAPLILPPPDAFLHFHCL